MSNKNIVPCVNWDGGFPWEGYSLRYDITTAILEYEKDNPRTWPLIRDAVTTECRSTVPPKYLAYDQTLIKSFKRLQGSPSRPSRTSQYLTNLFLYYPFNYNSHGQLREHPHIPPNDLEQWKDLMKQEVPTTAEEMKTEDAIYNDQGDDDVTGTTSPEAAIQEMMIMKIFDDTGADHVSAQRVIELEGELEKMRQTVLQANERADSEEKKRTAVIDRGKKAYEDLVRERKELQAWRTNFLNEYNKMQKRAKTAEEDACKLRGDLASRDNDLEKGKATVEKLEAEVEQRRKDISTANQRIVGLEKQIFKLFEKAKKKEQGTDTQKRAAVDDVSEAQRKKLKAEA
ncbi:unnamed protein product [Alternaria alternata]